MTTIHCPKPRCVDDTFHIEHENHCYHSPEVSCKSWGYPQSSSIFRCDFPWQKPSSDKGAPPWLWKPPRRRSCVTWKTQQKPGILQAPNWERSIGWWFWGPQSQETPHVSGFETNRRNGIGLHCFSGSVSIDSPQIFKSLLWKGSDPINPRLISERGMILLLKSSDNIHVDMIWYGYIPYVFFFVLDLDRPW